MNDHSKDLTTQEIINENQMKVQLIDDKSPMKKSHNIHFDVKVEDLSNRPYNFNNL